MSRWLKLFLLTLTLNTSIQAEKLKVDLLSESAILMNLETGKILYEKEAYRKQYPASITKVATAAYVLKILNNNHLEKVIKADQDSVASISEEAKRKSGYTFPSHWIEAGSSHMGIKLGEELTIKDLLYGLMVVSANDAANILAKTVGKTHEQFMDGMNAYVRSLGCKDTNFTNAHGLHHPKHVSTAYDMAIITVEALKNPLFREIVKTVRYMRPKTNKQEKSILLQHNRLLKKGDLYYSKAIGVKNGKTTHSGTTLIAAAKDGERTLIAVLLKGKEKNDSYKDAITLFEAAFNQPKMERTLLKSGKQAYKLTVRGAEKEVTTFSDKEIKISYYPAEEPIIKAYLNWETPQLPINKGDKVGEVMITLDGVFYKKTDLYASEVVKGTLLHRIKNLSFTDIPNYLKGLFGILIALVLFFFYKERSRSLKRRMN